MRTATPEASGTLVNRWLKVLLALVAAWAVASIASAQVLGLEFEMNDDEIGTAVQEELRMDTGVDGEVVRVSADGGVVTLNGTVESLAAKARAGRIARGVRGVTQVENNLEVVRSDEIGDEDLKTYVGANVGSQSFVEAEAITVDVTDGVATLTGKVDSFRKRELIEQAALNTRGVVEVRNNIEVEPSAPAPVDEPALGEPGPAGEPAPVDQPAPARPPATEPGDLRAAVAEALRFDSLVNDALIEVEVEEGVVVLTGRVASAIEKDRAIQTASLPGVRNVDASGLEVSPNATGEYDFRGDKYTPRNDEDIEAAVSRALLREPRISSKQMRVDVAEGVATITGTAYSMQARKLATRIAQDTVGVKEVRNELELTPNLEAGEDESLAENVRDAIDRDQGIAGYNINVNVADGEIYLHGTVDSFDAKAQVEDVVAGVQGVSAINNDIEVQKTQMAGSYNPYLGGANARQYEWYNHAPQAPALSDEEIRANIVRQFYWSPLVDGSDITIQVENGVASLSGPVSSYNEQQAAIQNAYEAGATAVMQNLEIR